MPSELERIADAVREVGDSSGQHQAITRQAADIARALASALAGADNRSATSAATALQTAQRHAARAASELTVFGSDAKAFADRLASGSPGSRASSSSPSSMDQDISTASIGYAPSTSRLSDCGLTSVSLDQVDFSDNPILDGFTSGGLTKADYRWAVETWAQVVGPGHERGMGRDEFAAWDTAHGATPPRSTAEVFDLFLRDDRIRISRRPDGTFDVIGGRHRIEVARELGITHLPAEVHG